MVIVPKPDEIFVFGSNLAGRHGKGAAYYALKNCGAIYGQAEGLQGRSYAIPTKGYSLQPLSLSFIEHYVRRFVVFADVNDKLRFVVTPIGCGLAGYRPEQIAPMFKDCTSNVVLPEEFVQKKP